jgi:ATP-dependent exoDNAse (exonuclease V) alpha subunit
MIGTKDMEWIIKRVKECGAKLVFVGDSGQLPSIKAGGLFESLGNRIGRATLTEIRRQVEPWARDMVHLFAGGEPLAGLRELAERGHVVLKDTMHDVRSALIKEWGEHTVRPANIILAQTTAEVDKLNKLAQEERLRRSEVHTGGFSLKKTDYHVGDRMIFLENNRTMGVKNGTTGTIKNIRRAEPHLWHRRVTVKIDGGKEICFSTRNYQDFDLAYAMTTHKAQGMTADKAFLLVQENHENREMAYVQVSRATTLTKLFMTHDTAGDELGEIAKNMGFSRAQTLATDMQEKHRTTDQSHDASSKSKDSSSRSR